MPHLFVSISWHGFGHLSQTAVVLNALRERIPGIKLTVQCAAPRDLLTRWIAGEFDHQQRATDIGMLMANAVDVRRAQSKQAYLDFHAGWEQKIAQEAQQLRAAGPDLILSNISYLTLHAAREAGIPAVALCSLNWADIFRGYFADEPRLAPVIDQMLEGYRGAECFLRAEPAMPMPDLNNTLAVGPLARVGHNRRAELNERLRLGGGERLVVIGLGGIPTELDMRRWPDDSEVRWLVPEEWPQTHPRTVPFSATALPYIDMLCSCDALLTKPGYGSFAEAACNGIPVLYVRRRDWAEEPYLIEWLHRYGRAMAITREQLEQGKLEQALASLWKMPVPAAPRPDGATQAAEILSRKFQSA